MKYKEFLMLQLFAEANQTVASDLEPAISVDCVSKITSNIEELQQLLGINEMEPMSSGTNVKIYKMVQVNTPEQVGEGETIHLTKVKRELARTIELGLKKKTDYGRVNPEEWTGDCDQPDRREVIVWCSERYQERVLQCDRTRYRNCIRKGTAGSPCGGMGCDREVLRR